jgi:hypothetical protein
MTATVMEVQLAIALCIIWNVVYEGKLERRAQQMTMQHEKGYSDRKEPRAVENGKGHCFSECIKVIHWAGRM